MKKTAIFFLAIVMIFCYLSPLSIYATDGEAADIEMVPNTVTYSCVYNSELSVIKISGTMSHDAMIKYKDYSLLIYRIDLGKDVESIVLNDSIRPIASSDMSIKFQFSFEIKDILDKFSRYAVFLKSPEGKLILTDDPQYVVVEGDEKALNNKKFNFKGVLENSTTELFDADPGTIIIPVNLNEAFSNIPKGYSYQNSFTQLYFAEEYINTLDEKIKAASSYGGKVYIQFLLPSNITDWGFEAETYSSAEYLLPCVYSGETLKSIDALTSFISERYNGEQNGSLSGIILGKQIDNANKYNACGAVTLEEYAEYYADYVAAVAISAQSVNSGIEIILPFSSHNTYSKTQYEADGFSSDELLELIIKKFDESFDSEFKFTTLIESVALPLIIDENGTISANTDNSILTVNNISIYDEYLKKLEVKYDHVPKAYLCVWGVDQSLKGNELALMYSYSYYKTRSEVLRLSSFIVSFENNENFSDIKNIIKHIDEKETLQYTQKVLDAFGIGDWTNLIEGFIVDDIITHTRLYSDVIDDSEIEFKGQYSYLEISEISTLANWVSGIYCKKMYIHPHESLGYLVKAEFLSPSQSTERGEVYYIYENPENLLFTPYISFDLMAENLNNADAIYEIGISLISDSNNYIETKYSVNANELTRVSMNIEDFTVNNKVKTIKITIRELLGNNDDFSLLVKGIVGQSQDHTSREIESLIFEERVNIMNQESNNDKNDSGSISYGVVFATIFVILGIGLGLLVSFRKDNSDQKQ